MKGLQLLLQSFGIKIDPEQIESAFERGKDALPKLVETFEKIDARMQRMEAKLDDLIAWRDGVDLHANDSQAFVDGEIHKA